MFRTSRGSLCAATLSALTLLSTACLEPATDKIDDADEVEQQIAAKADSSLVNLIAKMTPNDSQVGALDGHRYVAWTLIQLGAGDSLTLSAEGANRNMDTVLFLYRADDLGFPVGYPLAYNDDFGGELSSQLTFEIEETGEYAAVARRYDRRKHGEIRVTTVTEQSVVACGARLGDTCGADEYCDFQLGAICGWADATGVCKSVPEVCTKEYVPVCGCDSQTYGNACMANAAGTSVQHEGACQGDVGSTCAGIASLQCNAGLECNLGENVGCNIADIGGTCVDPNEPVACYEIYAPECGCDGVTYSNDCYRKAAGVPLDHEGECEIEAPADCRTDGCGDGSYCSFCWGTFQCIPDGALC